MEKERKIKAVVEKVTFEEAEKGDDEYWANASVEERLQELVELRKLIYGDFTGQRIKKVVFKGTIEEIENQT